MSVRRAIVDIDPVTVNVTEFCRVHGVSTWFFWELRRRYAVEGDAALTPKSRAPHRVANRTPGPIEDAIVVKRKELLNAGLDAGAGSIAFHLRELAGVPSEATIWRILKARGFITPDPTKAPKHAHRRFTAERANDCWQLDDTNWELADGTPIKILNVIDDHSRLAVASVALESCTGAATLAVLAAAATTLGWPARFLSDNAKAFRRVLAEALGNMGIAHGHSRPYHPQTNGKVERFHQTLKRWLRRQPQPRTIDELQAQLDIFRFIYNHERNHRSLDRRYPADVWAQAPKNGPADQPIGHPTRIYQQTVHGGIVHLGRRYRVSVGATYNGRQLLAIVTGTACHVFLDGQLIRALTLNPNRKNQPLHNRPGRPTQLP
jgi:transposase InsO family protein